MRRALAGLRWPAVAACIVALAACASSGASRKVTVDVDRIGVQYISGQVRSFLDTHGYERTIIEDNTDGNDGTYMVRTSDTEIMQFRSKSHPDRRVTTHLDKRSLKLWIRFTEQGVSTVTPGAAEEFDAIVADIAGRLGEDRVHRGWW